MLMTKTLEQNAKTLVSLTEKAIKNEDDYNSLIEFINIAIKDKKVPLKELYNTASDFFEDVGSFFFLQNITQSMISNIDLQTNTGETLTSSLFLVPIIFVEDKNHQVNELNVESEYFSNFINSFKESNFFQDDDSFFLHNHLYHPKELVDAQYEDVLKMTNSMTNFLICPEDDLINVNPIKYKTSYSENTLTIRFLLGVRIYDNNIEIEQKDFDIATKKFIEIAKPNIEKLLNNDNALLLAPDLFYDNLKEGLNLYSSTSLNLNTRKILSEQNIHPHGIKVFINLCEESDNLSISITSKLTDEELLNHKISIFDFTNPDDLLLEYFYSLESLNIKKEDMLLKLNDEIIPFQKYLKQIQNDMVEDFDSQVIEYQEKRTRKLLH